MWNEPSAKQLEGIPKLYETEQVPLKEKLIYLHFFIGGCDWYIAEFDGKETFWGFAILNNDLEMAEWGYVNFGELKSIRVKGWVEVDCDLHWKVRKACEIDRIREAQGWPEPRPKGQQLIGQIEDGRFKDFMDVLLEVTKPGGEFFGEDPYMAWEAGSGVNRN